MKSANRLRRIKHQTVLIALLVLLLSSSAHAQAAEIEDLFNLTATLIDQHQYNEAIRVAERALMLAGKEKPDCESDYIKALHNLATVYSIQKKYFQAETLFKRALTCIEARPIRDPAALCMIWGGLVIYTRVKERFLMQNKPIIVRLTFLRALAQNFSHLPVPRS